MNRRIPQLSIPGALMLALVASACGSDEPAPNAGQPSQAHRASSPAAEPSDHPAEQSWVLRYTSRCPGKAPENCSGSYGFSVSSDGVYQVGPGPGGESFSGWIETSEVDLIRAALMANESDSSCDPGALEGAAERLELRRESAGAPSCDPALLAEVRKLSAKYSPSVFPNPCIGAASALQKAYDELTRCSRDSDCAYLDEDFLPIEPGRSARLTTDDCTFVKPLVVANSFEAVGGQLKLLKQREIARRVCAGGLTRPACSRSRWIATSATLTTSPVCAAGVCRINPSVVPH